jgi:hypothetical protein
MRRLGAVLVLVLAAAGCGSDDDGGNGPSGGTTTMPSNVYFGAVAMTTDRLAVALDGDKVRAYVVDGEPGGDAEWFEGNAPNKKFSLTSASGRARIEGTVEMAETTGTVTLADGVRRTFHTIPATHGAGIYDVTVTGDGHYTGTSTDGSRMDARQSGDYVQGKITTRTGEEVMYKVVDLSRVFSYPTLGGQPGRYTMIVARHGLVQMGRGGENVKRGTPDGNLIALDLAASGIPTPGIYYGRVSQAIHQLAASVDPADPSGNRRIRIYFSDGLPEGDIEWFVGSVGSSGRFSFSSASGRATISGDLSNDWVKGSITTARGRPLSFFAVPAGEGAGIYDIEVTPDKRYTGTSEKGERLDLKQDGHVITGAITTPSGQKVDVLAYDLTDVFQYSLKGSAPDRYVAFASPGGRYFIGRNGDVRGGTAGNNIIGLDKAC